MAHDIPLPHPGVVLKEEFLVPMGLSVHALAKAIHVTRSRVARRPPTGSLRVGRESVPSASAPAPRHGARWPVARADGPGVRLLRSDWHRSRLAATSACK